MPRSLFGTFKYHCGSKIATGKNYYVQMNYLVLCYFRVLRLPDRMLTRCVKSGSGLDKYIFHYNDTCLHVRLGHIITFTQIYMTINPYNSNDLNTDSRSWIVDADRTVTGIKVRTGL